MTLLTLRDLQFRSVRFALVVIGTSVVFSLVLLMTGLANHFHNESSHAVAAIGADAWIVPSGTSGPFTSNATLDPRLARAINGVERADPIALTRATIILEDDAQQVVILGHVTGGLGEPRLLSGRHAVETREVVLDESAGMAVGEHVSIGGTRYRVVGISDGTTVFAGIPMAFMQLADARAEVFRGRPIATAILTRGTPTSVPDGLTALTAGEVADDTRKPLTHAIESIDLIKKLLWLVSAMVIGGMVYLSSMERRRDFAVLKAVGASTRGLLAGLATQGAMIALVASLLATGVQAILAPVFPMEVEVTASALLRLPAVAIIVALVAGSAGMRRVARTDPALAFSGPGA